MTCRCRMLAKMNGGGGGDRERDLRKISNKRPSQINPTFPYKRSKRPDDEYVAQRHEFTLCFTASTS
jgi:hypothetical protein